MSNWRDGAGNPNQVCLTGAKAMVNGDVVFTAHGDVHIIDLYSECMTNNDATASTMQWKSNPTTGAAATFSGASASLASQVAGARVTLLPTALTTAPVITASGAALGGNAAGLYAPDGTVSLVIGTGSTVGTWRHHMLYIPLTPGAYVTANQ